MGVAVALMIVGIVGIVFCAITAFYLPLAAFGVFLGAGFITTLYESYER